LKKKKKEEEEEEEDVYVAEYTIWIFLPCCLCAGVVSTHCVGYLTPC
jgi:hypothetical protein